MDIRFNAETQRPQRRLRLKFLGILATALLIICEAGKPAFAQNATWALGDNYYGQLGSTMGNGTANPNATPAQIAVLPGVIAFAAGNGFTLALRGDGTVWQFGNNYVLNQYNAYSPNPTPTQVMGLSAICAVSAGDNSSLALKSDGTVWAWGVNNYGQLGNTTNIGTTTPVTTPAQIAGLTSIVAIATGYDFCLALDVNGNVWSWGKNDLGELGNSTHLGTATPTPTPAQITGLPPILTIAAGYDFCLAADATGKVWAWGNNHYGQLGTTANSGVDSPNPNPAAIIGLSDISEISVGSVTANPATGSFALARDANDDVWAWGDNFYGQLGNATGNSNNLSNPTPARISGLSGIVSIAAGSQFSLALDGGGNVWAWGNDAYGQIGIGSNFNMAYPSPAKIPGLSAIVSIAAGAGFALALSHHNGLYWTPNNLATKVPAYWQLSYLNGNPAATGGNYLQFTPGSPWVLGAAADIDGDGSPDMIWQTPSSAAFAVWFMTLSNGTATFKAGSFIQNCPSTTARLVGAADFNGDGVPDLLFQDKTTGQVSIWYLSYVNNVVSVGTTVNIAGTAVSSGPIIWRVIGAADMNRDGYPDLVFQNTQTGDVVWWRMTNFNGIPTRTGGGYIYKFAFPALAPAGWSVVGLADMNGDGIPDLIWLNTTSDEFAWWRLDYEFGYPNPQVVNGGNIATPPAGWTLSSVF